MRKRGLQCTLYMFKIFRVTLRASNKEIHFIKKIEQERSYDVNGRVRMVVELTFTYEISAYHY
jgi:hypothetical protein